MPQWALIAISALLAIVGGLGMFLLTVIVEEVRVTSVSHADLVERMTRIESVAIQEASRIDRMDERWVTIASRLDAIEATHHAHKGTGTPIYPPDWRPR